MRKFNTILAAATVVTCFAAPSFAYYDVDVPVTNPMYHYEVLEKGETTFYDEKTTKNFTTNEIETMEKGTEVWANIINYTNGPALLQLGRLDSGGAYSMSESVEIFTDATRTAKKEYLYPAVYAVLTNQYYEMSKEQEDIYNKTGKIYSANIMVGNANSQKVGLGYSNYNDNTALYQEDNDSLMFTAQHEIGHTLGIYANEGTYEKSTKPDLYQFSKAVYYKGGHINPAASGKIGIYDKYLRINDSDYGDVVSAGRGMIVNADPSKTKESFGDNGDYVFDLTKGSPYFVGPKTMQALSGVTDQELIDAGKTTENDIIEYCQDKIEAKGGLVNYSSAYDVTARPTVDGMPIHPNDKNEVKPDLSHLELRNSMMSHQTFSNWTNFMEAELAVLNDIGYNIKLSDYFGKSYYLNNVTDTVTLNNNNFTKDFAIGVHVYGDNNTLTQEDTNITSSGNASYGVRIDGSNDTYNMVNSNILLTGNNSIGLGVTDGKENTINVDKDSSISVTGANDVAVSFDLGRNVQGESFTTKGSYVYYDGDNNIKPYPENQGALVSEFNIDGAISATGDNSMAIFISDNAHVENININDGAFIDGNIVSKWNSVRSGHFGAVQYETTDHDWAEQDPQTPENWYFTNLNINSDFSYKGNILGDSKYVYENKTYTGNTLKLNVAADKILDVAGDDVTYQVYTIDNKGTINVRKNLDLSVMNGQITGTEGRITLENTASLHLNPNVQNIQNTMAFYGGNLSLVNNKAGDIVKINNIIVDSNSSLSVDLDYMHGKVDTISIGENADFYNNAKLNVNTNIINGIPLDSIVKVTLVSESLGNTQLLGHITSPMKTFLTPIYKYGSAYIEAANEGNFMLVHGDPGDYESLNPAIMASSVAAQGAYLTQLNTYENAFANMDMMMAMPSKQRQALKAMNKLASEESNGVTTFSPNQIPEEQRGVWFRPFASLENVPLNGGPSVDNITYGGLVGGDSDLIELPHGIDMVWGAYAGYNGSHQTYEGNGIYQNGGTLGLNAAFYWKNFFTGITANIGASGADASTMYGHDYFALLNMGMAGKTGYNWELFDGKFIIQPNLLMSSTLINTFDYTNAAGVDIHSPSPLVAGQIAPGVKFIGNLPKGWQPYGSVQMMWNLMDKTYAKAEDVHLTETTTDPYVQYGVGVQKHIGDRFTGFGQVMFRNGGRNGVSFQAGFRWALGNDGTKSNSKAEVENNKKAQISLSTTK